MLLSKKIPPYIIVFQNEMCFRRGIKINNGSSPLISENMCACAGNVFLQIILYHLTNIDLVLKERVCAKSETKFHCFIATSYYMQNVH